MNTVLLMGAILLAGLLVSALVSRIKVPAITAYILLGVALGPSMLDLTGTELASASEIISHIVLGFIAFQLGSTLYLEHFRRIGRAVMAISISAAVVPMALVTLGVYLFAGEPFYVSILYGAIAAATDPAATMMVVRQFKSKGPFTDTLLGIVAIDDAWGILLFSFALFFATGLSPSHGAEAGWGAWGLVAAVGGELIVSTAIGVAAAYAVRWLGPSIKARGEALSFILGVLLAATGIALWAGVSPLLTNIVFGMVLVNIDPTAHRFFDFLKNIDWPLYIIFYVLVGANLDVGMLSALGPISLVYIVLRFAGKTTGGFAGGVAAGAHGAFRSLMGVALLPQAGVALALAMVARDAFPETGAPLLAVVTISTVFYQLAGPLATRFALSRSGETGP